MTPRRHAWAGLLVAAACAACADFREPAVVTIGAETWTSTDLRRAYAELDARWRTPLGAPEAREAFVDRLVERRLLAEWADSALSAENDPRTGWHDTADEILLRRLRVIVGSGAPPTEVEIAEAVERMQFETRIEWMQFPDEASAREAHARVQAGASFASVAADGPGAYVGEQTLSWRPTSNELTERASTLGIGKLSEPFRAGFVDVLIRPVDRSPAPGPPPEDTEVVRGLQARRAAERLRELTDALREQAAARIDEDAIGRIAEATAAAILGAGATQHEARWAIPKLDGDEELVVAQWEGGTLSGRQYVESLQAMIPALRPGGDFLVRRVRAAAEAEVSRRLLLEESRRRGLDRDRWVERALRKAREEYEVRWAMSRLDGAVGVEPAEVDSLREMLRSLPLAIFRKEDRALVLRYDLPTRADALTEMTRIQASGGGWARLRELFDGDPAFAGSVQLISVAQGSLADPDLTSAVLDPGGPALVGPFERTGRWVVVDRLKLEPSRVMTDGEIRQMLEERIRQDRAAANRAAWLAQRRRDRGVAIDRELLDALSPGG